MHALVLLSEETQGGSNLIWLLWVALGFFAMMVVTGWLVSRNKKQDAEPSHENKTEEHKEHH